MVEDGGDPVVGEGSRRGKLQVTPEMGFEQRGPLFVDFATVLDVAQ